MVAIGDKFGLWTVTAILSRDGGTLGISCGCGVGAVRNKRDLERGKSRGCVQCAKRIGRTSAPLQIGSRYGSLTVSGVRPNGGPVVTCDCGRIIESAKLHTILSGKRSSCGKVGCRRTRLTMAGAIVGEFRAESGARHVREFDRSSSRVVDVTCTRCGFASTSTDKSFRQGKHTCPNEHCTSRDVYIGLRIGTRTITASVGHDSQRRRLYEWMCDCGVRIAGAVSTVRGHSCAYCGNSAIAISKIRALAGDC